MAIQTKAGKYQEALRALLSPRERRVLDRLSTPRAIQDYLDTVPINFEETGETILSPQQVLRQKRAHCIEGALFAAASLAYHGRAPLLLDLQTMQMDDDHVVALYKQQGLWGAISKTNHYMLRWRDPVYRSVRELAMSFFHEYFLNSGMKTLLAYSRPFDLRRYAPERWVAVQEKLDWLAEDLDGSPHFPIVPESHRSLVRPVSRLERTVVELTEWTEQGRTN